MAVAKGVDLPPLAVERLMEEFAMIAREAMVNIKARDRRAGTG
jgi:hypothetical protein